MPQHVIEAIRPATLRDVDADEVAQRIATIHAELWLADGEDAAALVDAFDALGELRRDVGHEGLVGMGLARVHELIGDHLAGTIDLRDGTPVPTGDACSCRAQVEERLSALLFALLGLPPASD